MVSSVPNLTEPEVLLNVTAGMELQTAPHLIFINQL